jgi:hypothetical protein
MPARLILLLFAVLFLRACAPASVFAAPSRTEVSLAARLTDAQERLARAETTITALRAEAAASGDANAQKRHAETLAKIASTNDALGTLRGMAFEINASVADLSRAAARNARPVVTVAPVIVPVPAKPATTDAVAKRRHDETIALGGETNAELSQVLAMSADIKHLMGDSEAHEARRVKLLAERNAEATLAARLQVIVACGFVLQFWLLAAIYKRVRK